MSGQDVERVFGALPEDGRPLVGVGLLRDLELSPKRFWIAVGLLCLAGRAELVLGHGLAMVKRKKEGRAA